MKKFLLSSAALVALTAGAAAADMPSGRAAPAFAAAAPAFTWTGFYVGANVGYGGWGNTDSDVVTLPAGTFPATAFAGAETISARLEFENDVRDGALGGAQIGYNYQMGMFVVGVEADIQAANIGHRSFVDGGFVNGEVTGGSLLGQDTLAALDPAIVRARRTIDWFATTRVRGGIAIDRVLFYGTVGLAFGGGDDDCSGVVTCKNDDTRNGYAVGGGVEFALPWGGLGKGTAGSGAVTFKVEGLYVNLNHVGDRATFYDASRNVIVVHTSEDDEFGVARAGINFKF